MGLSYRNGVAVGVIVCYSVVLCLAIYLNIRHHFGMRSIGFTFIFIFALVRIVGSALQLATISNQKNLSLYKGTLALSIVGLSPLLISTIAMTGRVLRSIAEHDGRAVFRPLHMRILSIVVQIGMILGIVGGVRAGHAYGHTRDFTPDTFFEVCIILFLVAYVVILVVVIATLTWIRHAATSEQRLFPAVVLSLLFLFVRLVYSAIWVWGKNAKFNPLLGDVTYYLCMALIMELCVVVLFEVAGFIMLRCAPMDEGNFDRVSDRGGKAGATKDGQRSHASKFSSSSEGT